MATPPITIGEFTDVPAPGSPVASQWCQEVSRRVAVRTGCRYRRTTAQTASNSAVAIVSWTTKDDDVLNMLTGGTTFTVPTGQGGEWTITAKYNMGGVITNRFFVSVEVTSAIVGVTGSFRVTCVGEDSGGLNRTLPLLAGDTFSLGVFQNSGADQTIAASWMQAVRIGP
jgi:hypothetical protein